MSWLDVPGPLLAACIRRLPGLRAAEHLRLAAAVGIGTGSFREDAAREIRSEWTREIGDAVPRPARPDPGHVAVMASSLGIAVERT